MLRVVRVFVHLGMHADTIDCTFSDARYYARLTRNTVQCFIKSYYLATIDNMLRDACNHCRSNALGCVRGVLGAVLY